MAQHDSWGDRPAANPRIEPLELDMTIDGEFRATAAPPVAAKVIGFGILIAVAAGALAVAAVALWFAMMLVPLAIGGAVVAYGAIKFRQWRAGLLGGQPLAPRGRFGR